MFQPGISGNPRTIAAFARTHVSPSAAAFLPSVILRPLCLCESSILLPAFPSFTNAIVYKITAYCFVFVVINSPAPRTEPKNKAMITS